MEMLGMDWETFSGRDREEQEAMILALHEEGWRRKYALREGDRELSRKELLQATGEWKKNCRIFGGGYEWVEDRHVLSAAAGADLDLLLEVRAAVYTRLSDECLYDVEVLDRLIRWVGRSRYRKIPGVCAKVDLPDTK
jgi:hypothetical protein